MREKPRLLIDVLPLHLHQLKQSISEIGIDYIIILARLLRPFLDELEGHVELLGHFAVFHA